MRLQGFIGRNSYILGYIKIAMSLMPKMKVMVSLTEEVLKKLHGELEVKGLGSGRSNLIESILRKHYGMPSLIEGD